MQLSTGAASRTCNKSHVAARLVCCTSNHCHVATDIADAVEYAIETPQYVNIGLIELLPTLQVPGGLRTGKRVGGDVILTGNK